MGQKKNIIGKESNKGLKLKRKRKKKNLAKERELKRKIRKMTFGLTDALTNVALYTIYVGLNMPGGKGPAGVHRAFGKADDLISQFDAKQFRRALYNLSQKGLISSVRRAAALPHITNTGISKLEKTFPIYDTKRVWDKNIYLVVYDISSKNNHKRDILRGKLESLKAVMLQKSVYLTCYNPSEIIEYITKEYAITEQVLISTVDPKNAFSHIVDLREYLWEIYHLEEINNKYSRFIEKTGDYSKTEVAFSFLSIAENDPQLPFELLLDKYLGDKAYLLFRKLVFEE
jgi:DNA-binding transcriptional regulator PaaX